MIFRFLFLFTAVLAASLPVAAQTVTPTVINPDFTGLPQPAFISSGGPTIVYQILFEPKSDSINYRGYDFGYYVAPSAGGSGTLLLIRTTGGTRTYYTFTDFGSLIIGLNGDDRKSIISLTATSDVSTTAFFAIGDANETLQGDNGTVAGVVRYASQLNGYAVSADSQPDPLFQGTASTDVGVAGTSLVTFQFDVADSANAETQPLSVADTVKVIQTRLTSQGYVQAAQTNTGTGTGTSTSTDTTAPVVFNPGAVKVEIGPGDLLVYELKFRRTGESINYKPYTGGFYVDTAAPSSTSSSSSGTSSGGGSGTMIVKIASDSGDFFKVFPSFGSLFVAKSGSDRRGVMFATSDNSFSTTTFFAMGNASDSLHFKASSGPEDIFFGRKLTGYAFSADSQYDLPFAGDLTDVGVGGASVLTATYDESRSKAANKARRTIDTEVALLEAELQKDGLSQLK